MKERLLISALLIAATACASGAASSASTPGGPASSTTRVNPDVITADELADPALADVDVLIAVRRLRPRFLSSRGTTSLKNPTAGTVHASINGGSLQSVAQLAQMRVTEVTEIRYYSS